MTDREQYQYPPDEPVIGATYPPSIATQDPAYRTLGDDDLYAGEEDQDWDPAYDDDQYDEYVDPYYDDEYYEQAPTRQPMFYVFIGLSVILGLVFIGLLFALFRESTGDNGGTGTPITPGAQFRIQVESPLPDVHLPTGEDHDVLVSATSTEKITKFELFINGNSADNVTVNTAPTDQIYRATLRARFEQKGEYSLLVRVTSESGATEDSEVVTVTAVEPIDGPPAIRGRALTQASLYAQPTEDAEAVGTLTSGQEVTITGRTRDNVWLLLDMNGGGRWVRRNAIEPEESLQIVPVVDVTPTPTASASPTPSGSPTITPTPTPEADAVDFAPTTASLVDGGAVLRVIIGNLSINDFEGVIEVAASGVLPGTLTQAFNVSIPANGSATVEFELTPPVTTEKEAQVRVDPGNALRETNEDNNQVTIRLSPPVEQPELAITAVNAADNAVNVTIQNNGGPLGSSTVTVRLIVGQNAAEQSKTIALSRDNPPVEFTGIAQPGSGEGRVEILINGQVVASATHTFP